MTSAIASTETGSRERPAPSGQVQRQASASPASPTPSPAPLSATGTTTGDARIKDLRVAIQLLRMGNFDLKLSAEGDDDVARLARDVIALAQEMKDRITRDPMTKLLSRVATIEALDKEMDRMRRGGGPVAVMLASIDRFKDITEVHGYPSGDAVVREASNRINLTVRGHDHVGRYGANEFLVILTDVDPMYCQSAADRVRTSIRDRRFRVSGQDLQVTISIGVVVVDRERDMSTPEVIAMANETMSKARGSGFDQVEILELKAQG